MSSPHDGHLGFIIFVGAVKLSTKCFEYSQIPGQSPQLCNCRVLSSDQDDGYSVLFPGAMKQFFLSLRCFPGHQLWSHFRTIDIQKKSSWVCQQSDPGNNPRILLFNTPLLPSIVSQFSPHRWLADQKKTCPNASWWCFEMDTMCAILMILFAFRKI